MISVVLDCNDLVSMEAFWSEALRYDRVYAASQYVVLRPRPGAGPGPTFILQQVSEPRLGKNRMHVDLHTTSLESEVERVAALGATPLGAPIPEHNVRWQVMADPEGNEVCIVESRG